MWVKGRSSSLCLIFILFSKAWVEFTSPGLSSQAPSSITAYLFCQTTSQSGQICSPEAASAFPKSRAITVPLNCGESAAKRGAICSWHQQSHHVCCNSRGRARGPGESAATPGPLTLLGSRTVRPHLSGPRVSGLHGLLFLNTKQKASAPSLRTPNLPAMQETWVRSLGQEDPLEKGMATHSRILAWRIPWTEELGRLQSIGSQRVRQDRATNAFFSQAEFISLPSDSPQITCTSPAHLSGFSISLKHSEYGSVFQTARLAVWPTVVPSHRNAWCYPC